MTGFAGRSTTACATPLKNPATPSSLAPFIGCKTNKFSQEREQTHNLVRKRKFDQNKFSQETTNRIWLESEQFSHNSARKRTISSENNNLVRKRTFQPRN